MAFTDLAGLPSPVTHPVNPTGSGDGAGGRTVPTRAEPCPLAPSPRSVPGPLIPQSDPGAPKPLSPTVQVLTVPVRGSSGSTSVPAHPKAKGDPQVRVWGGNGKSTGAVGLLVMGHGAGPDPCWQWGTYGLLRSGTSPITGSKHKHPSTPAPSRAASPGPFLPPQSGAAPALTPSLCQMPSSTPGPPSASPTPQNPHGQEPVHHSLVPGGCPAPLWIRPFGHRLFLSCLVAEPGPQPYKEQSAALEW